MTVPWPFAPRSLQLPSPGCASSPPDSSSAARHHRRRRCGDRHRHAPRGPPRRERRARLLDGRAGNDTLRGLAGADVILGGPGRDTSTAASGDDRVPAHGDGAVRPLRCGAGRDIVTPSGTTSSPRDCEVVCRQISSDRTTDPIGQHATQVEPDTFAFGSTIVSVFQIGRVFEGGAVAIGFSTSPRRGRRGRRACSPASPTRLRSRASPSGRATRRRLRRRPRHVAGCDARHLRPRTPSTSTSTAPTTGSRGARPSPRSPAERATSTRSGSRATTGPRARSAATATSRTSTSPRASCVPRPRRTAALTWSTPVASSPVPPRGIEFNGAQPEVLPDGTLVLVYTAFVGEATSAGFRADEIAATRSTDGGATFSAPVRRVALSRQRRSRAIRTFALELGRGRRRRPRVRRLGRLPRGRSLLGEPHRACPPRSTASPGRRPGGHGGRPGGRPLPPRASARTQRPRDGSRSSSTRSPTTAPTSPDAQASTSSRRRRRTAAATWSKQQRLTAESIELASIARTRLGLMLADYVSTSFVRGRPVSVFVLASPRISEALPGGDLRLPPAG